MALDSSSGTIAITGNFLSSSLDFGGASHAIVSSGGSDAFLAKIDSSGVSKDAPYFNIEYRDTQ